MKSWNAYKTVVARQCVSLDCGYYINNARTRTKDGILSEKKPCSAFEAISQTVVCALHMNAIHPDSDDAHCIHGITNC
jgi:hypothetical protein